MVLKRASLTAGCQLDSDTPQVKEHALVSLQCRRSKDLICQGCWASWPLNNRAVWDFVTDTLYFMGPGDYELDKAMPPGTDKFQLETAPSGHSVLPCCEYTPAASSSEHTLTLMTGSGGRQTEAASSYASRPPPPRSPPPVNPPVSPLAATRAEALAPPPGEQTQRDS